MKLKDYIATFDHAYGQVIPFKNTSSEKKIVRSFETHRYLHLKSFASFLTQAIPISHSCIQKMINAGHRIHDMQHIAARRFRRAINCISINVQDKGQSQFDYTFYVTFTSRNLGGTYRVGETGGKASYIPVKHDFGELMLVGKTFTRTQNDGSNYKYSMS